MVGTGQHKLDTAHTEINQDECSAQVQELLSLSLEYLQLVQKLWDDTSENPGIRELNRRGYRYLSSLWYNISRRAEIDGKPMSAEFNDLVFFCRYVGPRPTDKHSLHRLDNDIGYRIGNVEWADKRKQAEVRRNTQHHLYLGRRMTDRAVAEFIATKGHKTSVGAIKKQRQRLTRKGIALTEVTRLIFEHYQIPYATSIDPVEAWDFPPNFHEHLTKLYPHFRRTTESRIAYFIRWLDEQAMRLRKSRDNPYTSEQQQRELTDLIFKYSREASWARDTLKKLHQQQLGYVLKEAAAPFAPPPQLPVLLPPPSVAAVPNPPAHEVKAIELEPTEPEAPGQQYLYDKALYSSGLPSIKSPLFAQALEERRKQLAAQGILPPCNKD